MALDSSREYPSDKLQEEDGKFTFRRKPHVKYHSVSTYNVIYVGIYVGMDSNLWGGGILNFPWPQENTRLPPPPPPLPNNTIIIVVEPPSDKRTASL